MQDEKKGESLSVAKEVSMAEEEEGSVAEEEEGSVAEEEEGSVAEEGEGSDDVDETITKYSLRCTLDRRARKYLKY